MPTLSFDYVNKQMTVDLPDTTISAQEIVNAIRTEGDRLDRTMKDDGWSILPNLPGVVGGKFPIGGGAISAIIMDLAARGWAIGFAARPGPTLVKCVIDGGTFANSLSITFPTANTHVFVLSPVDGVGGVASTSDLNKIDDLHSVQVRDSSVVVAGDVRTFTHDGGRQIVVDDGAGTRTATGVESP